MEEIRYVFKNSFSSAIVIFLKYFLVALIPFITILIRSPYNIASWGQAAWQSLIILAAVIAISIIIARSNKLTVTVCKNKITAIKACRGIIIKTIVGYDTKSISCIRRENTLLTALCGAVTFSIIPDCKTNKAIYKIRLSRKNAICLKGLIESDIKTGFDKKNKARYSTGFADVLYHSLLASNAIGGVIVLIPTINYIGKIFGQSAAKDIFETVDSLAQMLLSFVPYALGTVVLIVIIGWAVSFLKNFAASYNTASVLSDRATISCGFLFKKHIYVPQDCMSGICIKMSIIGILFKMYDVFAVLPHMDKNKHRLFAGMYRIKKGYVPKYFKGGESAVYPKKRMWYKFIMIPFFILAIMTAAILPFFSFYLNKLFLLLLPIQVIMAYWLFVEIINYKLCYFKIENGFYKGVCRKGLSIIYVCIPCDKSAIIITQSIFQKRDKSCNIKIILPQNSNIFKIRNLNLEKLSTFSTEFST